MATTVIELTAYLNTDTPSKLAVLQTEKDIVGGAVVTTSSYVDFGTWTKIEAVLRNASTKAVVATVDSVDEAAVFEVQDQYELLLRLGHVVGLTAGTEYELRLIVYDSGDTGEDDGIVLVDFDPINTSTIITVRAA